MPINEKKKAILVNSFNKLKQSKTFSGSERNILILEFLLECYLKGIHVKESVLEIELFKEQETSVSYDGKVRVYMFNLRKKLEEYYRNEGENDNIIFNIKKGQYNLSIEEKGKQKHKTNYKRHLYYLPFLFLCATILLVVTVKNNFSQTYCWKSFFNTNIQTVCCVGDHFIVESILPNGRKISTYISDINSDRDFENYLIEESKSNHPYEKATYSFVTKMGPVGTAKLGSWFAKHNNDFSVVMEYEVSVDNLTKNNIIYIGPFRTMDVLSELFLRDSKDFSYDGRYILDKHSGNRINDIRIDNSRQDHVMVSYNRLTDSGRNILFFASNNDIGVLAAVKNFTNQKWLNNFYKNIPENDSYFNALFTVKGIGRTDLECELVQIEILE